MWTDEAEGVNEMVDTVYRAESRRVLATLIRLLGDFDLAEETLHDAFKAALEQWPRAGVSLSRVEVEPRVRPVATIREPTSEIELSPPNL